MKPDAPPLLTVDEFASMMRVHPRTVRRWTATGAVCVLRIGGVVRVPASEIARLTFG